jgi:hypothetical protein
MSTTETTGPDWLSMKPGHFDVTKLPAKHRKPDPDAMWTVADLMPAAQAPALAPEDPDCLPFGL